MAHEQQELNKLFKRDGFNAVWDWLQGHGPDRWRLAVHWTEDRIRNIRKRPRDHGVAGHNGPQNAARWETARRVYRRHLSKAEHKRAQGKQPRFKRWMLNGHPGNIEGCVKRAIAREVGHDVYVTATTDGQHAVGSYHYPANNPDGRNLGRAADFGGTKWIRAFRHEHARGCSHYLELFGPPTGYCKDGQPQSGTSPDVPNHCHCAPAHG